MRPTPEKFKRIACRLLVPALLLWLGGTGFLHCCAHDAAAPVEIRREAVNYLDALLIEGEVAAHCAVEAGEGCCPQADSKISAQDSANFCRAPLEGGVPCCSALKRGADRARKPFDTTRERETCPAADANPFLPQSKALGSLFASNALVHDRSGTYLRDCVFLI